MSFADLRGPSSPLFKEWKILRIKDILEIKSCPLVHDFLKGKLPQSFENFFQKCSTLHTHPTRFSNSEGLYRPHTQSVTYGMKSITNICIHSWSNLAKIVDKPSSLSKTN